MTLLVNQVPSPRPTRARRARLAVAIALLVLGGVVAAIGNVAVWARDTALDTDTYLETVVPLSGDVELSAAASDHLTDELFEWLELEDLAASALPEDWAGLSELVGPAEALVRPLVEDLVEDVLESEAVADLWATMNREGHELLVEVLRDEYDHLSIDGDDIVLDLSPAVAALDQRLGEYGINVLDRIPDDALRFVIYQAPEVGDAVEAIDALEQLAVWLPIAAVLLLATGIAVGPRRLRLLGGAGASVAAASLLVLAVEAIARGVALDRLTEPVAEIAGRSLWDLASGRLVGQTFLLVIIGGTVAAFGFGLDFARRNLRTGTTRSPGDESDAL